MPLAGHITSSFVARTLLLALCCFLPARLELLADTEKWVPEQLIKKARKDHGYAAASAIEYWRERMHELANVSEQQKLKEINKFFNDTIPYISDQRHWGKEDYWATPYESLATRGGDCEDYVIAKYYSLRQLGVDTRKLRITYVKAIRYNQAHMVLTYFPTPDAVPYVLDNLIPAIKSADRRDDLSPVYSFNGDGMWLERMKGEGIRMGNPNKLDLWTDLRVRMHQLGMEL